MRSETWKCQDCDVQINEDNQGRWSDGSKRYVCIACAMVRNRRYHLMRCYSISLERYDQMLFDQGGGCAVCGEVPSDVRKSLDIDHDHDCCSGNRSCGRCVRGLLCHRCNKAIGMLRDDVNIARSLYQYLGGS